MKTKFSILCGAAAVLATVAQAAPGAANCNRGCLEAIPEQYLAAMVAHNPSQVAIAPGTRYTENGVELKLPDGLWRIASSVGKYRLKVSDPETGEIGFFAKAEENGAPNLVGTPGQARADVLGDAPRAAFLQSLAPSAQRSRQEMIAIANTYCTRIENNTGTHPPLFADDCNRIEDGAYTTNRPLAAGAEPNGANYSCKEAFTLGFYHDDTRLRDRRYMVIDRERGLVYAGVGFDHDATVRSYTLKNGKTVKVTRTAPWTWMVHEIFQINQEGRISRVEAILLSVPYGMPPAWDTGVHVPDPAASKDGFKEVP